LSVVLRQLRQAHPEARLLAGVEATGGFERTWLAFFQRERAAGRSVALHRLNPLAVKRFLDADLHRKVDDARAAKGIAQFLMQRMRERVPLAIDLDGRTLFYRNIRGLIDQRVVMRQRFQALLSSVQPELVQFCSDGIPDWLLLVCQQYPTASRLARSHQTTLAAIPHVGAEKAERLRAAAKTSVAAYDDAGAEASMLLLVEELLHLDARIDKLKGQLIKMMNGDPAMKRLDGIPGIGPWSAASLVLEIGDVTRFADVRQLIAWAGLDPRVENSGDGTTARGISHRGNAHLRAILFPLALGMMLHNPVIGGFIRRKVNEGKPTKVAIVAGAAKLLRIVFALLVSGKDFDPHHEANRAAAAAQQRQAARPPQQAQAPEVASADLSAPVSAQERKRRKTRGSATDNAAARTSRQCEVKPQERDRQAAATTSSSTTN
jgi:transposase